MERHRFWLIRPIKRLLEQAHVKGLPIEVLYNPLVYGQTAKGQPTVSLTFPCGLYDLTVTADPDNWCKLTDISLNIRPDVDMDFLSQNHPGEYRHPLGLGSRYSCDANGHWNWNN